MCSYLLHGCDVIRIFKLCIEERGVSRSLLRRGPLTACWLSHCFAYTRESAGEERNEMYPLVQEIDEAIKSN